MCEGEREQQSEEPTDVASSLAKGSVLSMLNNEFHSDWPARSLDGSVLNN